MKPIRLNSRVIDSLGRLPCMQIGIIPMSSPTLKPGNIAPGSGQYQQVGPRGGVNGPEITSVIGRPLPPTTKPGQGYVFVDPTNNGSGHKE